MITPVRSNALILSYAFNNGSIFFGSVLPITTPRGRNRVPALSYYCATALAHLGQPQGRSASSEGLLDTGSVCTKTVSFASRRKESSFLIFHLDTSLRH